MIAKASVPELKALVATGEPYEVKDIAALTPKMAEAAELTDVGNAATFAAQHGKDVRFVASWKQWLVWNGVRWVEDERLAVQEKAKATGRRLFARAGTDEARRPELLRHARHTTSRVGIRSMLDLACSDSALAVSVEDLDKDNWLLNVKNGTIDLRTGNLREHQRDDLITKLSPIHYDPNAECPAWLSFVNQVFDGDQEVIDYMQRAVGYVLTGSVEEQCLFFLHGTGKNGKSTFVGVVLEMLGDYAIAAAPNLLMAKVSDSHPTEQADLHGKRFVVCQETEQGRKWAETTVKQLTGGDAIRARRMRKDFFQFLPTHKFFVAGNHKPQIVGTDEGIWRRLKLVPFKVTIPDATRDPRLAERLRSEHAGILRWAVQGCLAWQSNPLSKGQPVVISGALQQYREEQDVFGGFLNECCVLETNARITKPDLYALYKEWCEENGASPLGHKNFTERLREKGLKELASMRTAGGNPRRGWEGVRKRLVADPPRSHVVTSSQANTHQPNNATSHSSNGTTADYKRLPDYSVSSDGVQTPQNAFLSRAARDTLRPIAPSETDISAPENRTFAGLKTSEDPWAPMNWSSTDA